MNKVIRKIIVWGLIIVIGIPNVVLGAPEFKIFGVALIGGLIYWDNSASKKDKPTEK